MITTYSRGHKVTCRGGGWVWADNGEPVDWKAQRPCARCGRMPTPEGYDACLGYIPDAAAACCGHGVLEPFITTSAMLGGALL